MIDAKVSYRVNSRLRIFAEFLNLNEEPLRTFHGVPSRSNGFEIYSWNANVGLTFNL